MQDIRIECVPVGEIGANCYIVENTALGECVLADPGAEAERIIRRVGKRMPKAVLLTHGHFDHIGAADEVCAHFGVPLYVHEDDASKLTDAAGNVSALFGSPMTVHTKPELLHDGDVLDAAGMHIEVLHTPGHSAGSVCYRLPDNRGLITGDTMFAHGYGRTDFSDGSFEQICQSLRMLMKLTPRLTTYPGHEGPGLTGRDRAEEA